MASIPLDQPSRRVVLEAKKLTDDLLGKLDKTGLTEQQVGNIRSERLGALAERLACAPDGNDRSCE